MAVTSKNLVFSDHQAVTATAASTNVIDLSEFQTPKYGNGPAPRDLGAGDALPVLVQVTEDFNNLTSLKVAIEVDDNEAFSSAKEVIAQTILLADLKAGKKASFQFIPEGVDERYIRLRYTVAGTAPTTGKVWAGFVTGRQTA